MVGPRSAAPEPLRREGMPEQDRARGVYAISVVAEIVGIAIPTVRLYERRGLLEPRRTDGGTRRYSQDDVVRLRRIAELVAGGVNLSGVALVLRLQDENDELRQRASRAGPSRGRGVG